MRKGIFIPDITVEMFRKATLESVEEFMTSGQMEDIEIPDRPHGEWIKSPVGSYCSNCKSTVPFNPLGKEYFSPFCMECGADMRKEGEAE